jgi:hypothetical protein
MRIKSSIVLSSLVLALASPVAVLAQDNAPPAQGVGAAQPDTAASNASGQPQVEQPDSHGVNWKGVGIGAGTVATNVFYIPAKLAYGIVGGIAGGAGYVLTGGNSQVSDTIWRSSLGGDYVVTPDMMTGKDPVHFSGPTATSAPLSDAGGDTNAAATNPTTSMTSPQPPSAPASSIPSASQAPGSGGTHAIDSGAGPIKSGSPMSASGLHTNSYAEPPEGSGAYPSTSNGGSHSSMPTPKYAPLPDTSIE